LVFGNSKRDGKKGGFKGFIYIYIIVEWELAEGKVQVLEGKEDRQGKGL